MIGTIIPVESLFTGRINNFHSIRIENKCCKRYVVKSRLAANVSAEVLLISRVGLAVLYGRDEYNNVISLIPFRRTIYAIHPYNIRTQAFNR